MTFKEGKIIENFRTKDGREIIIRYPKKSDLKEVWRFYNKVITETKFLSRITPVSLKDEDKWLIDVITKMKKRQSVNLIAESSGKIVGSCDIHLPFSQTDKHVGEYGIAIIREFTGVGLGKCMSNLLIETAQKELKIEMVKLSVYGNNKIAQGLYKKLGFVKAGEIPRGIKHNTEYTENIIMYKVLKK